MTEAEPWEPKWFTVHWELADIRREQALLRGERARIRAERRRRREAADDGEATLARSR